MKVYYTNHVNIKKVVDLITRIMKNKQGFTLIELLIVIGIIAILAAAIIIAVNPGEQLQKAREASVKSQMQAIATGVFSHMVDEEVSLSQALIDCTEATVELTEPAELDEDGCGIVEIDHPLGGSYELYEVDGRVQVTETEDENSECVFDTCHSDTF